MGRIETKRKKTLVEVKKLTNIVRSMQKAPCTYPLNCGLR